MFYPFTGIQILKPNTGNGLHVNLNKIINHAMLLLKSDKINVSGLDVHLHMNYLAHAHLSFGLPQVLVGNMISDFVKGNKQYQYNQAIQKGIRLHRSIDSFTDAHTVTREMKQVFKPAYGLYAGAFTDIVYDYFLANDSNEFASVPQLEAFSLHTYEVLEQHVSELPAGFQSILPYMKLHNWLFNYRHTWGIEKSFYGLVKRAKYLDNHDAAFSIFTEKMPLLKTYYDEFFPLLKNHAEHTLEQLLHTD